MTRNDPQIKIRLEPDVKRWLEDRAKSEERPQTWIVNNTLKKAMQDEQKQA